MRQKIDYGIDLGTTNSAIARMESGEALIIKSDDNQMDTTPSCVSFNKKKTTFVGLTAKNSMDTQAASSLRSGSNVPPNSYIEFKRTMGTDHKYESTYMEKSYLSEELSSEVIKKLRSYVRDEDVSSVIITVPAMFKQNQIDATQRAAELAGIKYCELLQEPIAASIAYGIKANTENGHWLVFDFGGGTFDAALMHVDDGIMKVIDTEGDNHLGGKNIDISIVDKLLIPAIAAEYNIDNLLENQSSKKLLQDALKTFAERAKIALSSKQLWTESLDDFGDDASGEEIETAFEITLSQYEEVCSPIFQVAVDICKKLLERNHLKGSDLSSLILVGGPTFSQTLRGMLKKQITPKIDFSIDPMTSVAKGAAIFASTKNIPIDLQKRDASKVQLTLKYPETTVEVHENLGVRVDRVKSTAVLPKSFFIEIIRSDKAWSSGKVEMEGDAEIVEVSLNEGKANQFDIKLFGSDGSIIPCEPSSITIIHGLKIANPTLPFNIGLDLYNTAEGKQGVYPLLGLEKNSTLPAKGKGTLKTAKDIRPGNKNDKIRMHFYDFSDEHEGSRAILNNPIGGVTLTGEDLPALLPSQSDVHITLSIDASRRISLSIYFPTIDETIERTFESMTQGAEDTSVLNEDLELARDIVSKISLSDTPADVSKQEVDLDSIEELLSNRGNDSDIKDEVRTKLQKAFIELDKIESTLQWPAIDKALDDALENLLLQNERYGNDKSQQIVSEYHERIIQVRKAKDINIAKQLIDEMFSFSFALVQQDIGLWMNWIKDYDQNFETINWNDKRDARSILNNAKSMMATNPSKSKIEDAVRQLWDLLPKDKREADSKSSDEILRTS